MSFFKTDKSFIDKDTSDQEDNPVKLRYVVEKDGNGYWLRPESLLLATDYDEDVLW